MPNNNKPGSKNFQSYFKPGSQPGKPAGKRSDAPKPSAGGNKPRFNNPKGPRQSDARERDQSGFQKQDIRRGRGNINQIPQAKPYSSSSFDRGYEEASSSNRQYDRSFKRAQQSSGSNRQGEQGRFGRPGSQKPQGDRFESPAMKRFGPGSSPNPRPFAKPANRPFTAPSKVFTPATAQESQLAPAVDYAEDMPQVNLLTGRNPIREAIKTGRDLEKLMIAKGELSGSAREIVSLAKKASIMIQSVERSRLDQLARNHQGMIAFASAYQYSSVEEILDLAKQRGEAPFIIILDQITDPHNLGAVIRSAACAGVHGVIVPMHRAVGLTPAAVKASAGAVEHIKVARVTNLNQTIKSLQKQGIWLYAAMTEGEDFRTVKFDGPCALVIGSEGEGVSQLTASLCDKHIKIPMQGEMNSLNASVAAGVLMYAVYAKRYPV